MANVLRNTSVTSTYPNNQNVSHQNTTRAKLIKGCKVALPPVAGGIVGGGIGFGFISIASLKGSVSVIEVAAIMAGSELGSLTTTSAMMNAAQISGMGASVSGAMGIALVVIMSALVGILVAYGIKAALQTNVAGAHNALNDPSLKGKKLRLLTDTTSKRKETFEVKPVNHSVKAPKKVAGAHNALHNPSRKEKN